MEATLPIALTKAMDTARFSAGSLTTFGTHIRHKGGKLFISLKRGPQREVNIRGDAAKRKAHEHVLKDVNCGRNNDDKTQAASSCQDRDEKRLVLQLVGDEGGYEEEDEGCRIDGNGVILPGIASPPQGSDEGRNEITSGQLIQAVVLTL